jgi:hypothetical protein
MASGGSGPGNGPPRVYKEGILYKRARGLHKKRINWQERYCKLTSTSLDYYDPGKKQVRKYITEREREREGWMEGERKVN